MLDLIDQGEHPGCSPCPCHPSRLSLIICKVIAPCAVPVCPLNALPIGRDKSWSYFDFENSESKS